MARCTLDDLVPSIKCNRIFLEPVSSLSTDGGINYGEYDVVVDASVRDIVDPESGIAEYMLSDFFRNNVVITIVHTRNRTIKDIYDYLNSITLLTEPEKAYLFKAIVGLIDIWKGGAGTGNAKAASAIYIFQNALSAVENIPSVFSVNDTFYSRIRALMIQAFDNLDFELEEIRFSDFTTQEVATAADKMLDPDGNIYYDVKIPLSSMTFTNSVDVQNCYLFMIPFFDIENAFQERAFDVSPGSIPLDSDTINYYYKAIDFCPVLENKRAAGANIQDFRISERVAEIIRQDRISVYDNAIDQISLISTEFNPDMSSITSDLYASYMLNLDGGIYLENYFYFGMSNMLRRKSRLSFMYHNIIHAASLMPFLSPLVDQFSGTRALIDNMLRIRIHRVRVDAPEDPVLVLDRIANADPASGVGSFEIVGNQINNAQLIRFTDTDFRKLTYGEYTYKIEIDLKDPMAMLLRTFSALAKTCLSRLSAAMNYIDNNATEYNEVRDEISEEGKIYLNTLLNDADFTNAYGGVNALMIAMTGETLESIAFYDIIERYNSGVTVNESDYFNYTPFDPIEQIQRRKIENLHRIVDDLLFQVGKFANLENETVDSFESAVNNKSASENLLYSRIWNSKIKANLDRRKMVTLTRNQYVSLPAAGTDGMIGEYSFEFLKHVTTDVAGLETMNFLTPRKIGNTDIVYNWFSVDGDLADLASTEQAVMIAEAVVNKPEHMQAEIYNTIYQIANEENYDTKVSELRNNKGFFENILHGLGGTITNKTANNINTSFTEQGMTLRAVGIDGGQNTIDVADFIYPEAENETQDIDIQRSLALGQLTLETAKTENLAMDALLDRNGYRLLDRKELTQGVVEGTRFKGYSPHEYFVFQAEGKPRPRLLPNLFLTYYSQAQGDTKQIHPSKIMGSRFIVDNTFLVMYMDGFDDDMNPQWKELIYEDINNGNISANGKDVVLCKLERYQLCLPYMKTGQGSSADLEITNKYFYLQL